MVVSVGEKALQRQGQVWIMETNTSEPLITCRKRRNAIKTGGESLTREEFGGCLYPVQAVVGMKAA